MTKIELVITDIDGVWTDGGMYYDQTGNDLFEGIFKDSVEKALVDVSVIEEPQDDDVEEESLEEPNE